MQKLRHIIANILLTPVFLVLALVYLFLLFIAKLKEDHRKPDFTRSFSDLDK